MLESLLDKYSELLDPETSVLGKGPKVAPLNIFINIQKAGTLFFLFALMVYYNNFSLGAWVYLALHGSYGIIWFIKDMVFPDKGFRMKVSLFIVVAVVKVLLLYWGIGFLMMSRRVDNNPSPERIFICIFLYAVGLTLMMCTDLQKYMTLKYKKGLIDEYFLKNNRNTNYLGEMMIYSSFAILVNHIYAFYLLLAVWLTVFVSRINMKERSLKKKEGYLKYKNSSYLLLFKFFESDVMNIAVYGVCIALTVFLHNHGATNIVKHYFNLN